MAKIAKFAIFTLLKFKPQYMEQLPNDVMILFSYINTKLRDEYSSLDALCEDLDIDRNRLLERLAQAGFEYDANLNKFL